ncbi:dihydroxyacetone kinase subunit L [Azospirillum canadense]|uniref:dihydroxyacetone kinase subunit L n=1 Tax=Azospirillum canadense TaxID=403962 RepID=UPI00222660DE|nr:dihydroxyacetone kinase subunit L [Azospirillum canadense]MCW2242119.1 dihydroxyacetone kinase-like protein [Azospirillum canadense]
MAPTIGTLTIDTLGPALDRLTTKLEGVAPELNELDGRLGDGDLGATLEKCARNLREVRPTLPPDLGQAFKSCAMACSKASGSSFGTLLAVAFLTLSKATAGRTAVPWAELPALLGTVLDALTARGGASLGDKTVLDTLEAARAALAGLPEDDRNDPSAQHRAASATVAATVDAFRDRPNRIGRARMFADRSIGLDDPGMIAFRHMLASLGPA